MLIGQKCITKVACLLILCFSSFASFATHIVGGEMSYKYLDSSGAGFRYAVSLVIYEDCLNGSAHAIASDNPAFVAVYDQYNTLAAADSAFFSASETVPANFDIECVNNPPGICLIKKTFGFVFTIPSDTTTYIIEYQRCCRNGALVNVQNPVQSGTTIFCSIPPASVARKNSSAFFKNFPPQIICANTPLFYNHSAIDPDGDSLSYELCTSYNSNNDPTNSNIPPPPPFEPTKYVHPPYSFYNPLTGAPPLSIDPVTGYITCTPSWQGRYLVTVCCNEWRNGIIINTIHREFQFVVTECSKKVAALLPTVQAVPNAPWTEADPTTYVIDCKKFSIHFNNTSVGGVAWKWDFGVVGANADTSNDFEPTFTYPDTGTYSVTLIANPGSTCADSIIKKVKVYPPYNTAFSDSGTLCPGVALGFKDASFNKVYPINHWLWHFGDGDTTSLPVIAHQYEKGGTYNVTLVTQNEKQCLDSVFRQVVVDDFLPSAGKDTIVVKGEHLLFHGSGGVAYEWLPANDLENPNSASPTGYYPDTGRYQYFVNITSTLGCKYQDTINVWVVGQPAFYLPTAFTPNGDGKNDIFRPVTIGFRSIDHFSIYNRWGELVYFSRDIDEGWDGSFRGQKSEIGSYYWQIKYVDRNGNDGFMKGEVTLVR